MPINKKYNTTICLKLSKDEKQRNKQWAKKYGLSMCAYFRVGADLLTHLLYNGIQDENKIIERMIEREKKIRSYDAN